MARFEHRYINMAERAEKIAKAEDLGLRMLHDTFDADWKRGDEPHGTMIFTDEPIPVEPEPEPVRDYGAEIDAFKAEMRQAVNGIKAEIEKLKEVKDGT